MSDLEEGGVLRLSEAWEYRLGCESGSGRESSALENERDERASSSSPTAANWRRERLWLPGMGRGGREQAQEDGQSWDEEESRTPAGV